MKTKSLFTLTLLAVLTLGLASVATSAITRITNNGFEDSFPKTAGGYVVWQGQEDIDWEIYLYNANNGSGPVQITDNTYHDINPETDGNYVTWAAGAAEFGEIFIYDIATGMTTQLTDDAQYDHHPKVVNGMVVWASHDVGVDTTLGKGDIVLYNIAEEIIYNISALVDPSNIYDDYAFRFDGNRILWSHEDEVGNFVSFYYDIDVGEALPAPEGISINDNAQIEGDFLVFARKIGGSDREIMMRDKQVKRGHRITDNAIEDTQPMIRNNIVVWKGGQGSASEIYMYTIEPLFADADYDFELDIATVNQMVLKGKAGGGAKQYRWLLGETALTGWRQVVDGQAPLDMANKTGFVSGPQTLTLEVSNGKKVMSDQVSMNLQNWALDLVSPDHRSKQFQGIYPEFTWSSSPSYSDFKIQISRTSRFWDAETVTYPSGINEWMSGVFSFNPDAATTTLLDTLLSDVSIGYWRVITLDRYGNRKASETRSFIITAQDPNWSVSLVSPAHRSKYPRGTYPEYTWSGSVSNLDYKIQISRTGRFWDAETVTYPSVADQWMADTTSFTPDQATTDLLNTLLTGKRIGYWRITAKDVYGNKKVSDTRSFIIK